MATLTDYENLVETSKVKNDFSYQELVKLYNFNQYECTCFLNEGYLTKPSKNHYRVERALVIKVLSSKLLKIIHEKRLTEGISIIEELISTDKENVVDYNFYLYLMAKIIEMPEELDRLIKSFKAKDLYNYFRKNNSLVDYVMDEKIGAARFLYKDIINSIETPDIYDEIVIALLDILYNREVAIKSTIADLLDHEEYDLAINVLSTELQDYPNQKFEILLYLLKLCRCIEVYKVHPKREEPLQKSFYDYILSGNFEDAVLKGRDTYLRNVYHGIIRVNVLKAHESARSLFYRLLQKIIVKKEKLKEAARESKETILVLEGEAIIVLSDTIEEIQKGDIAKAKNILSTFLEKKDKLDFLDFIIENILLSIKMEDNNYYIPFKTMAIILSGNHTLEWTKKDLASRPNRTKKYVIMPTREYNRK